MFQDCQSSVNYSTLFDFYVLLYTLRLYYIYILYEYAFLHYIYPVKLLITEPRGYPCQNLNIIVPPTLPGRNTGNNY